MNILVKILLSSIAVIIASYLLPGVYVDDFITAVIVAVLLALLNSSVKPLLILFTIPLTVFTLGLFLLVINALIILMADAIVPGFEVYGFWWALIFSLLLSLINALLSDISKDGQK
ncbi:MULTISPECIES: phage holin family protein [unclassified Ekhidna]|jgi:putative membrane protein|uniref:phage holin family protein n=1 Tax=unclassified Ekhidna TaxID=2632188 RepID=UPI0032DECCBC